MSKRENQNSNGSSKVEFMSYLLNNSGTTLADQQSALIQGIVQEVRMMLALPTLTNSFPSHFEYYHSGNQGDFQSQRFPFKQVR